MADFITWAFTQWTTPANHDIPSVSGIGNDGIMLALLGLFLAMPFCCVVGMLVDALWDQVRWLARWSPFVVLVSAALWLAVG